MKQAIAGVAPVELGEATIMTVWPTIAASAAGRWIGRMCMIGGKKNPFAPGKAFALALIPVAVTLFALGLAPWLCRRYRLTNRRVIVQKGLSGVDERFVALDRFDAIDVEVLPGQEWFPAGDLIFRKGGVETFRLAGVPRPETFRQTCLKAHKSFVLVRQALGR
jgi:hypothetical protein